MRILIVTHQLAKVGGIETYLDALATELAHRGHGVAVACETATGDSRESIRIPPGAPCWCALGLGVGEVLSRATGWNPELVFTHGLGDVEFEHALCRLAPALFFAHGYLGTCIAGEKSFKLPTVSPCHRLFGWQCLVQYYPRRCGGLSPLTMWRDYNSQSKRLEFLRDYAGILTASDYIRGEYISHGLRPERVHCVPLPAVGDYPVTPAPVHSLGSGGELHLLFAGRMTSVKGGTLLLDALHRVVATLRRPLRVTFAGDGPQRSCWQSEAHAIQSALSHVTVNFVGWCSAEELGRLAMQVDLLVVPSLWPEPFGMVGPELGRFGVPAVAFDIGGISEWLFHGVNGYLAPADSLSSDALAGAIIECLRDPIKHRQLREGALRIAARFTMENHLARLLPILDRVARASAREVANETYTSVGEASLKRIT
jgi:glycosyltransferase involved in cell wall biosynthesis